VASASAVAELLPAFDYYQLSQLDAAYAAFDRASRSPLNSEIRAMAHLMMGNIENRRHRYAEAEQNYRLALEDRPGFVRARLGLAQVGYQRATGGCDGSGLDAKGLAVSERDYAAVLNAPESSEVTRARATFGLGQIRSCRSQALLHDEWAQARAAFRSVISLHRDEDNLLTRGLASEAYAGLALADSPSEGGPAQTDASRRAAEEYLQAATLAIDPPRAALFRRLRAHLNQRLGNYAEACTDLAAAKAKDPAVTAPSISATCPIPEPAPAS
jgi:tetratricopeptide (TPR) repeat protein